MLKHDIGRERGVPDDAARLKVPLGINEGPRCISFQLLEFPHPLSEQEPTEEACRKSTYPSVPHMMQVLRSFRPFLIKRRRVPT
jgi:hypothetical protein